MRMSSWDVCLGCTGLGMNIKKSLEITDVVKK